jgi:hypothetical protein
MIGSSNSETSVMYKIIHDLPKLSINELSDEILAEVVFEGWIFVQILKNSL